MNLQEGAQSLSVNTALSHTGSPINALNTHFLCLSTNMDPLNQSYQVRV